MSDLSEDTLPRLATITQVAAYIGWTAKALRRRIERGQVPGVVKIGHSVYLRRDEVLAFVREGRGPSPTRSR